MPSLDDSEMLEDGIAPLLSDHDSEDLADGADCGNCWGQQCVCRSVLSGSGLGGKNVTKFRLPGEESLLHIVGPREALRY